MSMPLTDTYASINWFSSKGATNNTTPVVAVSDPGAGQLPFVCPESSFNIINLDTANVTFTLKITGGTSRIVEKITLATGDKFVNDSKYTILPGETLTVELSGTITTTQPEWSVTYFQMVN